MAALSLRQLVNEKNIPKIHLSSSAVVTCVCKKWHVAEGFVGLCESVLRFHYLEPDQKDVFSFLLLLHCGFQRGKAATLSVGVLRTQVRLHWQVKHFLISTIDR